MQTRRVPTHPALRPGGPGDTPGRPEGVPRGGVLRPRAVDERVGLVAWEGTPLHQQTHSPSSPYTFTEVAVGVCCVLE